MIRKATGLNLSPHDRCRNHGTRGAVQTTLRVPGCVGTKFTTNVQFELVEKVAPPVQVPKPASVKSRCGAPWVITTGDLIVPPVVNVQVSVSVAGVVVATAALPKFTPLLWISVKVPDATL